MIEKVREIINSDEIDDFIFMAISKKQDRVITVCHTGPANAMIMLESLPDHYLDTYFKLKEEVKSWTSKNTSTESLN